tara:strand:- start:6500 stop:6727 length:228 start_codon:yes stop_codon:yes gene_type:complete
VNERTKRIHKETLFSVLSALLTQFPLNYLILWLCIEQFGITSPEALSVISVIFLTISAYIRIFYTRLYFSKRYKE